MKLKIHKKQIILIFPVIWFLINLLFLSDYPFVHGDEPWLSGLSRSMIESSSLSSTEDFFDLYERNPHAIKILFHLLQIPFIKTLGYSIFSVRLISLLAGCVSLYLFYSLILKFHLSEYRYEIATLTTLWLALDIQFIYISHLARQEIILILILLLMLNSILTKAASPLKRAVATGLMAGIGVGVHPNSFIIVWPVGLILLYEIIRRKRDKKEGLFFLLTAGITASFFVLLSFQFNSDFLQDYSRYGEALGVLDTADIKLLKLPGFYSKLFNQISGTYHTPDIRFQMLLFPVFLFTAFRSKDRQMGIYSLLGFAGYNIALVIIGKYSQPSISFLLPFYYLSASAVIAKLTFSNKKTPLYVLILVMTTLSFALISKEIHNEKESFEDYLKQVNNQIPETSIILGDLVLDYAVPGGRLYDWRNLHFLKENNLSLEEYIKDRDIQYIVLTEELSFIYENRPYWNVLYGNTAHWYPRLIEFTEKNCTLLKELSSPAYGIRVAAYRYNKPWYIKIYMVNDPALMD